MKQTLERMTALQRDLDQAREKSIQSEQKIRNFQREKAQLIQKREEARASKEDVEAKLATTAREVEKLRGDLGLVREQGERRAEEGNEKWKQMLSESKREAEEAKKMCKRENEKWKQVLSESEQEVAAAKAQTKKALDELRAEKDRAISEMRKQLEESQRALADTQRDLDSHLKTVASSNEVHLLKRQCIDVLRENKKMGYLRDRVSEGFPQWFQAFSATGEVDKSGSGWGSRIGMSSWIGGMSGSQISVPGPLYKDLGLFEMKVFSLFFSLFFSFSLFLFFSFSLFLFFSFSLFLFFFLFVLFFPFLPLSSLFLGQ